MRSKDSAQPAIVVCTYRPGGPLSLMALPGRPELLVCAGVGDCDVGDGYVGVRKLEMAARSVHDMHI